MKISSKGINLVKQFEGCRLTAYRCPAGVWTIGYGHTDGVRQGQKISAAQAECFLRADMEKYEKKVDRYNKYGWNQNEFDALVSFAFNVGSIDQLTGNGTRSRAVIADKMLLYNKGGGKVLAGLTRRRQAERALFLEKPAAQQGSGKSHAAVRRGSRGEDVTVLQKQLAVLGYTVGNIDGIFGIKTQEAVRAFQADRDLAVDGIAGPKTWAALGV